jgi:hypothetical protein
MRTLTLIALAALLLAAPAWGQGRADCGALTDGLIRLSVAVSQQAGASAEAAMKLEGIPASKRDAVFRRLVSPTLFPDAGVPHASAARLSDAIARAVADALKAAGYPTK